MQFAKELVTAAIAKGESALGSLPSISSLTINPAIRSSSQDGQALPVASTSSAAPIENRVHRFKQELAASRINIHGLKRLAFHGIPDKDGLRAVVWKVLLGYLPLSPDEWKQALARRRTQYHVFCHELIVDPKRPMQEDGSLHTAPHHDEGADPLLAPSGPSVTGSNVSADAARPSSASATAATTADPLSNDAGRQEGATSLDQGPLASIKPSGQAGPLAVQGSMASASSNPLDNDPLAVPQRAAASDGGLPPFTDLLAMHDVTSMDHPLSLDAGSRWRTFFQDNETLEQITRDVMRTHPDMHFFTGDSEESELHRQEMRRALFMYAKLNPGLRYIQGMNELIAPLYYLFKHDKDDREAEFAEADAFWCFLELISEFRDHFCAQLDNAQTGIRATLRRLMQLLQHCDYELWQHIEIANKVDPQYYSFRWITLLLSQEFAFPDTLRIWDTILGDPHGRMDCLLRICVAMILHVKPRLMQGDFTVIMKTLQRFPPVDIGQLLQQAAMLPTCEQVLGHPV